MARQMVLSRIRTNIRYSKYVELTTYQTLYWYWFLGMYLRRGRAFRAYSTHWRCERGRVDLKIKNKIQVWSATSKYNKTTTCFKFFTETKMLDNFF